MFVKLLTREERSDLLLMKTDCLQELHLLIRSSVWSEEAVELWAASISSNKHGGQIQENEWSLYQSLPAQRDRDEPSRKLLMGFCFSLYYKSNPSNSRFITVTLGRVGPSTFFSSKLPVMEAGHLIPAGTAGGWVLNQHRWKHNPPAPFMSKKTRAGAPNHWEFFKLTF